MNIKRKQSKVFGRAGLLFLLCGSWVGFLPMASAQVVGPGSAIVLDGSTGYVQVPGYGNVAPTNEITIEFWEFVDAVKYQSTVCM